MISFEILMIIFVLGIPIISIAWLITNIIRLVKAIINGSDELKLIILTFIASLILAIIIFGFYNLFAKIFINKF